MRFLMLLLGSLALSGCGAVPQTKPAPRVKLPDITFAAQTYPNQQAQCKGLISSKWGHIQWLSATTADAMPVALHYYNRKTGILKRRTKPHEHLWALTPPSYKRPMSTLALMTLDNAERLHLLCTDPVPPQAQTAIIMTTFTAAPPKLRDYAHAVP